MFTKFDELTAQLSKEVSDIKSTNSVHLKMHLFEVAHSAISEAIQRGYYTWEDFSSGGINFSEVCDWCGWPDLQDGGIFEQAIAKAWEACKWLLD